MIIFMIMMIITNRSNELQRGEPSVRDSHHQQGRVEGLRQVIMTINDHADTDDHYHDHHNHDDHDDDDDDDDHYHDQNNYNDHDNLPGIVAVWTSSTSKRSSQAWISEWFVPLESQQSRQVNLGWVWVGLGMQWLVCLEVQPSLGVN